MTLLREFQERVERGEWDEDGYTYNERKAQQRRREGLDKRPLITEDGCTIF